ncbi:MAG: aldo/keto reductase [Bacteroidaceae bacterium]
MESFAYLANANRYKEHLQYRRSGNSGILLPEISLGLWKNFGADNDFKKCTDIIHYAFDHGITHFDLANNYGPPYGEGERTFGRIMRESLKPYRDELFLATKAGYDMWEGPYGNWGSRKYLMASLDQSLKRMNIAYVDLFYIHRYDPETPLEETLQALVDMVRMGKALYVGISRWPLEATRFAFHYLRQHDVPALIYQGRFNLLDRAPQTEGILSLLEEEKVGFIGFSPLAQGLLTNRYLNGIPAGSRMSKSPNLKPEVLTTELSNKLSALHILAKERGESLAQMSLAWILAHKKVTSVLVGASSVEQLQTNLLATQSAAFSHEELQKIETILA